MCAEGPMKNNRALAPWIKHFLLQYLPAERNFARNTQHSYRDALRLLVIFASTALRKKPDELLVEDLSADLVRRFMRHIEEKRKCSVSTRNQRLAAVRTLAAFIGERSPEDLLWCAQIRSVPFKRSGHRPVGYLERSEIDALLAAPDRNRRLGCRDHTLLLFMYNSGARADEVAQLTVSDLRLHAPQGKSQSFVQLRGKGNKIRFCPLWASTTAALKELVSGRADNERVFLGRSAQPMTRFGVHDIVTRYARIARDRRGGLRQKRVVSHTRRIEGASLCNRLVSTIAGAEVHFRVDTPLE
ncbi:MAG: integrase [Acidobacteria bacterium]|nr:MAG: integrase [Acidobacteriota bacterium]